MHTSLIHIEKRTLKGLPSALSTALLLHFVLGCSSGTLIKIPGGNNIIQCEIAEDCNDGNECTDDTCDAGACNNTALTAGTSCSTGLCDDAGACVECVTSADCAQGESCVDNECGTCIADLDCDDGNPCTDDSCNLGVGCEYDLNNDPCDDGIVCTVNDFCHLGFCNAGTPSNSLCFDGNPCTLNTCNATGCMTFDNNGPCDDGIACTSNDGCADQVCQFGIDNCQPGNECNLTSGECEASSASDDDNDGLLGGNDPCPNDPRNLCFGGVATDLSSGTTLRINASAEGSVLDCAGTRIDCNGDVWHFEQASNMTNSDATCNTAGGASCSNVSGIDEIFGCSNAATQDLFECGHEANNTGTTLSYFFDVADGEYLINMFFANTSNTSTMVGQRIFDISLNGDLIYDDFDQVAAAGGGTLAVVRSARLSLSGGQGITLGLINTIDPEDPVIRAIEVLEAN